MRIEHIALLVKDLDAARVLVKYFNVDMSDSYLQNGEIRYILLSGKKILKYGWINRENNFADNIIRKKNGEYEITGSSQTHLD